MKKESKMNKKKKFSIFSFLIFVLTTIFVFSLNKTFAETPEVSVSGKIVDTIKMLKYQITKEEISTGTYNSGQPSESTLIMIYLEKMLKQGFNCNYCSRCFDGY